MKSYNGFTPYQIQKGFEKVKQAIAEGRLKPASQCVCSMCGQSRGIIMYHSEDYTLERIVDQVVPLCWRCHMMLHSRFSHPKSWEHYKKEISEGVRYKPVYRHDFSILENENFID